jgi:putative ABC transport system permease protein
LTVPSERARTDRSLVIQVTAMKTTSLVFAPAACCAVALCVLLTRPTRAEEFEQHPPHEHGKVTINAALDGSQRSRVMTFTMQRAINEYRQEPLLAILPGVALSQLWELVGVADTALMIVAAFVVLAGLLGMLTAILTSLNERRREMAVLHSVGARPRHVFALLVAEAGLLATLGVTAGIGLTYLLVLGGRPLLEKRFGIFVALSGLSEVDLAILGGIIAAALLMGLLPAFRAYRNALSDGLQVRV